MLHVGVGGAAARSAAAPCPLPCQDSHNSTRGVEAVPVLTGSHLRSAFVLSLEIVALAKQFGLERLGFLTLTFADQVVELKEANRRFDSLNTHVLRGRYSRAIVVPERQDSGRVHFHLVVVAASDIRSGVGTVVVDFKAFERRDYRSANEALRAEWAFWRETAPKYGFGRTELLPVKSSVAGVGRYVGTYIAENLRSRSKGDKGARLVRYLGYRVGDRRANCRFGWANGKGWAWRRNVAEFARRFGARDTEDLVKLLGPRWAYMLAIQIERAKSGLSST